MAYAYVQNDTWVAFRASNRLCFDVNKNKILITGLVCQLPHYLPYVGNVLQRTITKTSEGYDVICMEINYKVISRLRLLSVLCYLFVTSKRGYLGTLQKKFVQKID